MKRHFPIGLVVLFASFCLTSMALGAFNIPNSVYRIDQLEQAKKEAMSYNKQIVFLYSDENTTCPLASRASTSIIERFKQSAVIVYFNKEDWPKVPRIVKEAIKSPASGKFIPKTIVVNAEMTGVVSIIPYESAGK